MNKHDYFIELEKVFNYYNMKKDMSENSWKMGNNAIKDKITELGLKLSNVYHAHGIGNNNEYYIYKPYIDDEGFLIEKKIARYYYCYSLYGGMIGVSLTEL